MSASLPDAPLLLQTDPGRLEQVFVNLLSNAAKYTNPGGRIWLSAEREQGEAVVRIRDTGIGIDSNALPHVFELFVQADPSSRRADPGSGTGSRWCAVWSNVTVVASARQARAGGGSSQFTVRLPIAAE